MAEAAPPLHRVLARQLRRAGLSADTPPEAPRWGQLLAQVSETYTQADADRYTLERSIDISSAEMRGLHDVLSERALLDQLTGLANRTALMDRLKELIAAQRVGGPASAVIFIDLDGFKLVNDSLGHEAGDELLVRATERMRRVVRGTDMVARLGGDEFVIVCPGTSTSDCAQELSARLAAELEVPFRISGRDAVISASLGVASTAESPTSAEDVLRRADLAMYAAKAAGGGRHVVFDDRMQQAVDRHLSVKSELGSAIARDELRVHYQPIVRLSDERVIGAEALVRWERPGHGLVPPADFIGVAEEGRLIGDLDSWVLAEACRRAARWCRRGGELAVNLSPRSLDTVNVVEVVSTALHANGIPPHSLLLELTEESLVSGTNPAARAALERLSALGVRLGIDDFGTGYSSLARLRTVHADTLKLDRSLVSGVDEHADVAAIVSAAVAMGHALGHRVVAEGVERRGQAELLRSMGCDAAQGWLFARPGAAQLVDDAFRTQAAAKAQEPDRVAADEVTVA